MLTGELRNQIDGIWNDFWSGGLANPLQVIEQITYLIFIKRLDEMQELEERKATTLGSPIERRIFPEGADERGEPYAKRRWTERNSAELQRPRIAQSFCVPKADIMAAGYDLSLNRYKEVEHEEVAHESPAAILADLRRIEAEIAKGMKRLEEMLG